MSAILLDQFAVRQAAGTTAAAAILLLTLGAGTGMVGCGSAIEKDMTHHEDRSRGDQHAEPLVQGEPPVFPRPTPQPAKDRPRDMQSRALVVLVHGMGRTPASMLPLRWALERDGFEVENWGYRSRSLSVAESAEKLAQRVTVLEEEHPHTTMHFVGHSLGNIVIRYLLAHHRPSKVGRVVMLAPPNQGSAKADALESYDWLLRPLAELTTDRQSTARSIPTPEGVQIGIIAGDRDNKVSVEETQLEGQSDHIVVASGHTFIMSRPKVHRLVISFLHDGRFAQNERVPGQSDAQVPSAERHTSD